MGSLTSAWLVGEGIVIYRYVKMHAAPPVPGALLASSGLFVLLALLAEAQPARFLANALAWGFDAAAFFQLYASPPKAGSNTAGEVAGGSARAALGIG